MRRPITAVVPGFSLRKPTCLSRVRAIGAASIFFLGIPLAGSLSDEPVKEALPADPWNPDFARVMRDPFLPPGYQRPSGSAAQQKEGERSVVRPEAMEEEWAEAEARLSVRGISRMGSGVAALIGHRVVSVGDHVELLYEGRQYRWRIEDLNVQTGVRLERHSARSPGDPVPGEDDIP